MDKQKIQEIFSNNLLKYRTLSRRSQEDLAFYSNVSTAYLSELERGEKCPTIFTVYKISAALNISPSQLMELGADELDDSESYMIVKRALNDVPGKNRMKLARVFEQLAKIYDT
ncbi:MAG: helix-turn-helix domain-containing protein [Oscillospiraceae bacterium]|nr:helix-turn-helix domain-containing protein [Oscillospiraceae bacterium]